MGMSVLPKISIHWEKTQIIAFYPTSFKKTGPITGTIIHAPTESHLPAKFGCKDKKLRFTSRISPVKSNVIESGWTQLTTAHYELWTINCLALIDEICGFTTMIIYIFYISGKKLLPQWIKMCFPGFIPRSVGWFYISIGHFDIALWSVVKRYRDF